MYLNNEKLTENQMIQEFFTKFYDISCSIEASNYTIDEFYQDFPQEMHVFLEKFAKDE